MTIKKRILIIDDEKIMGDLMSHWLSDHACEITCFTNSILACQSIYHNQYDCVVSDVEMPDVDGFDILKISKASNIPCLMMSADHNHRDECIKEGAHYFFNKPVEKNLLLEVVNKLFKDLISVIK